MEITKEILKEINKGIEKANNIIQKELSFGQLADLERVSKYQKYIQEMNELKIQGFI